MSTRAAIGYAVGEEIHTIYSHFDGYPKHVGKILQEHYASADKAEQLVHGPQIRNFDHDGTCVRFSDGTPHGSDHDSHEVNGSIEEAIEGYDYLYLFDFTNLQWECYARDGYVKPDVLRRVVIPVGAAV
jgi:hypothetical protein